MQAEYLQSLIDGLNRKEKILDELTVLSKQQQQIVSEESVDWEAFDKTVDQKGELVDELNRLDDGFSAVFDRIKEELMANKATYADVIRKLQEGVKSVTDKSTSLMALEQRTKALVTNGFGAERQKIKNRKYSTKAANNYYNSMNRMNYIDPQLMDSKK